MLPMAREQIIARVSGNGNKQVVLSIDLSNPYIRYIAENIYDQIPNEQFYDAPYEMRTNDEVYEPEPVSSNVITINGISVR